MVDKQVAELDALRKYEIKMLVRIDKEFSDITYVPTSSLGSLIDTLCKRDSVNRLEDEFKDRPYYNYDETIKQFDESAAAKRVATDPEL